MKTFKSLIVAFCITLLSQLTMAQSGTAQLVKRPHQVGTYDKLNVRFALQIRITEGDADAVEVEAEPEMQDRVQVGVKNGELTVEIPEDRMLYNETKSRKGGTNRNSKPVMVTIHVARLSQIKAAVACTIESSLPIKSDQLAITLKRASSLTAPIAVQTLTINADEASKLNLEGTAQKATIVCQQASRLNADKLTIGSANIKLQGSSNATVHVTETLSASADGVSTLTYSGNPKVESEVTTGLSKIRRAD
ncbi:head GIN domain-containing protein [Spirosoma soli]|uniref:Head GIN domain-containing protein n=1 Tax=Spirosoma soli TaxID=1770529 RepID=A0ABW5M821_9BACT